MKWLRYYVAAILLHVLGLWLLTRSPTTEPTEIKHYVEVTIEAAPPPPPETPPLDTPKLGQAPGPESATPSPAAPALASTVAPETTDTPTPFTRQAADRIGPTNPGVMGGTGEGTGGGGNRYKVIAVPEGLTLDDAFFAALAWGGRLAVLDTPEDVDFVFKLADDPKYWRNAPKNSSINASAEVQKMYSRGVQNGQSYDMQSSAVESHGVNYGAQGQAIKRSAPAVTVQPGSVGPLVGMNPNFHFTSNGNGGDPTENRTNVGWTAVSTGGGYAFYGMAPNSRQANLGFYGTPSPEGGNKCVSYAFVAEFVPVPRRPSDESLVQNRRGAHTFEVIHAPDGINWYDAQAEARARGGYLAIIRSAEENRFVFSLLQAAPGVWARKTIKQPPTLTQPVVQFTVGPWLGGFKTDDGRTKPWAWRWFHNVASPNETGASKDRMTYANWDYDDALDGTVKTGKNAERSTTYALLYVSAGHTAQLTWGAAWPEYLNNSYVVEYDDPPGG